MKHTRRIRRNTKNGGNDMMEEKLRRYVEKFNAGHEEWYANLIPDAEAADWMAENVPLLECDDEQIEETYYFRWWTYRKHIKMTPEGYAVTEFLPQVGWSGKYNTIACPVGHHISEGRWLKNKEIVKDDIRCFLAPDRLGDLMHYTNTIIERACRFCLENGEEAFAREIFAGLERYYAELSDKQRTACGLYWSHDGRDGMEYSISGDGLRPTINAYQYGAAKAMAELCGLIGSDRKAFYESEAETLRGLIDRYLWDEKDGFYKTVPMKDVSSEPDFARSSPDTDAMEEIGYTPWCFAGLAGKEKDGAFRYLTDPAHFSAPWGITTADMAHPRFMKNPVRHECLWDGPVWPYATSQTLTGIYTMLSERECEYMNGETYMKLLGTYAASHVLYEGGRKINWIDEDMEPFTGQWIARDLIRLDHYYEGRFKRERGADYNHSTFCDLVLSGACGISGAADSIRVKPLAAGTWRYFAVKNLFVGSDRYDIYYDTDGRYGFGEGVTVLKNGEKAAFGKTEAVAAR